MATVYTDGACACNGKEVARSSYAFYCIDTGYKESGLLPAGMKQTNNTAELFAVKSAIGYAIAQGFEHVLICSDSRYVIDSMTIWDIEKKVKGRQKHNYDLIKSMLALLELIQVSFEWVKGHSDSHFNNVVDWLAEGALNNEI